LWNSVVAGIRRYFRYNWRMKPDAQTVLEWSYEPADFFEESEEFDCSDGKIEIKNGKVRGAFDASLYEQGRDFRDQVHEAVLSHFLAQQVQNDKPYSLSSASMSREYADGRRDVTAFGNSLQIKVSLSKPDVVIRDAAGNIVSDTKADRLKRQKEFREKVSLLRPNDGTLRRILQSYNNALADPENILIHLYEIRDAIAVEYETEAAAKTAVNASSSDWSKFGRMANNDPLLEGRHRGKHTGLRALKADELAFAKSFSRSLIEGYVGDKAKSHATNQGTAGKTLST
jgi:hypothetical protein